MEEQAPEVLKIIIAFALPWAFFSYFIMNDRIKDIEKTTDKTERKISDMIYQLKSLENSLYRIENDNKISKWK